MVNPQISAALVDRYTILREIGQGGMASVYLAEDVRHERKVALKVLRPELAAVVGIERFLKEIKTTANLQHPHILPLHDSGEAGGAVFYVMPYVEGESLRDRLARDKQLPVDDAVRVAREVLSALDYAHRHGVLHRDIKPENILLHDGQALVADFGIALAMSTAGAGTRMTETGMSLGTPHYMSPEQAMGEREVSARSDVYAVGCVLYEMLLGEPPFTGPTAQAIIARVITEEPRRLLAQRKTIPPHVEAAVLKSLAKLPADRFASAAEFAEALSRPGSSADLSVAAVSEDAVRSGRANVWRHALVPGLTGVAVAAIAIAGWALSRARTLPDAGVVRFEVAHPAEDRLPNGIAPMAITRDGRSVVFATSRGGRTQLLLRRMSDLVARTVPGTESALSPFFSPDGEWIAFTRGSALFKVPVNGGSPTKIADVPFANATGVWTADGWILLGSQRLYRVRSTGGSLEELSKPDQAGGGQAHTRPAMLPDGDHVLFAVRMADGSHPAILSLKSRAWQLLDLGVAEQTSYSPSGHLVYAQANRVMAVPFDIKRLRVTGAPVVVDSLPAATDGSQQQVWHLVVAENGTLAQLSGTGATRESQLVWVDRTGSTMPADPIRAQHDAPRLSPSGEAVVVGVPEGLYIYDLRRGGRTRIAPASTDPVWSRDGRLVVYAPFGGEGLWSVSADGSDAPRLLFTVDSTLTFSSDWSPDGSTVAFYAVSAKTGRDILVARRDGASWKVSPFLVTAANERSPGFSPDGKWIVYASDESGQDEIYVRPYPAGDGKWTVSRNGGREPVWSRNGREIFYRRQDQVLAVPVLPGPGLRVGEPVVLFGGRADAYDGPNGSRSFDVTADGQRFLMRNLSQSTSPFTLTVLLSWPVVLASRDGR